MIRRPFLTILYIFLTSTVVYAQTPAKHHNKIDDLHSTAEIEALIRTIELSYKGDHVGQRPVYKSSEQQQIADSLPFTPWLKADLDGNGYTDLVFVSPWQRFRSVFYILDSGSSYHLVRIYPRFPSFSFPEIKRMGPNTIFIHHYSIDTDQKPGRSFALRADTLVFKYGGFIEWHDKPDVHQISSIHLHYGSFWSGDYDLTIDSARHARVMTAYRPPLIKTDLKSVTDRMKRFDTIWHEGTVDIGTYTELKSLLNYIHFTTLDSVYISFTSDIPTGILDIDYDGTKRKRIDDRELHGTYGLTRIYEILDAIRNTLVQ